MVMSTRSEPASCEFTQPCQVPASVLDVRVLFVGGQAGDGREGNNQRDQTVAAHDARAMTNKLDSIPEW
jgi:hypothetical protein